MFFDYCLTCLTCLICLIFSSSHHSSLPLPLSHSFAHIHLSRLISLISSHSSLSLSLFHSLLFLFYSCFCSLSSLRIQYNTVFKYIIIIVCFSNLPTSQLPSLISNLSPQIFHLRSLISRLITFHRIKSHQIACDRISCLVILSHFIAFYSLSLSLPPSPSLHYSNTSFSTASHPRCHHYFHRSHSDLL